MISRIWHGYTTRENADPYEELLRTEILPDIAKRGISGYKGAHLLRRDIKDEVEFSKVQPFLFGLLPAINLYLLILVLKPMNYDKAVELYRQRGMLKKIRRD